MFENVIHPDTSSFGWPIFFAVVAGLAYIIAVGVLLDSVGKVETLMWAVFPLAQLVYVVPLTLRAKKSGERRRMQGWIVGAAVAALLYAPCWGLALAGGMGDIR